jgi:hypothetical protein
MGGTHLIYHMRDQECYTCLMCEMPASHFSLGWQWGQEVQSNSKPFEEQWLTERVREAVQACRPQLIEVAANVMVIQFDDHIVSPFDLAPILYCCDDIRRSMRAVKREERRLIVQELARLGRPHDAALDEDGEDRLPRLTMESAQLTLEIPQRIEATGIPDVIAEQYRQDGRTLFTANVDSRAVLKVRPAQSPPPKRFIWKEVKTDEAAFDEKFRVQSNSEDLVRSFLGEVGRRHVTDLFELPGEPLVFDLSGGVLRVLKHDYLEFGPELSRFLTSCMGVLHATAIKPGEVSFKEAAATSPGCCQVCLAALVDDAVRCAKCRTPHHRECWDYIGGCSIFACGSSRAA